MWTGGSCGQVPDACKSLEEQHACATMALSLVGKTGFLSTGLLKALFALRAAVDRRVTSEKKNDLQTCSCLDACKAGRCEGIGLTVW